MNLYEFEPTDNATDQSRPKAPFRKSTGPGRERKLKARRASTRKNGGAAVGGIHRRGSKRRDSSR